MAQQTAAPVLAFCTFASKGHELFATISGSLHARLDCEVIDRLWNSFIAVVRDGKDDPKLALLRFVPAEAEIWLNEHSLVAGLKVLMGRDPKKDTKTRWRRSISNRHPCSLSKLGLCLHWHAHLTARSAKHGHDERCRTNLEFAYHLETMALVKWDVLRF